MLLCLFVRVCLAQVQDSPLVTVISSPEFLSSFDQGLVSAPWVSNYHHPPFCLPLICYKDHDHFLSQSNKLFKCNSCKTMTWIHQVYDVTFLISGLNVVFSHLNAEMFEKEIYINYETLVMLYVKVSLLQCNYTLKYWVIIINHMYLL